MCSINSFNYWGEGTQIEPARPVHAKERFEKTYLDYGSRGSYAYLHIAKDQRDLFGKQLQARTSSVRARRDYSSLAELLQHQPDLIGRDGVDAGESALDIPVSSDGTEYLVESETLTGGGNEDEFSDTKIDNVVGIDDMPDEASRETGTSAATSGHNSDSDDEEYVALREL